MRSGGVDDLLESLPGCPTLDDLRESEHGPLLVAETARVPAGGEEAYAAELRGSSGRPPAGTACGYSACTGTR